MFVFFFSKYSHKIQTKTLNWGCLYNRIYRINYQCQSGFDPINGKFVSSIFYLKTILSLPGLFFRPASLYHPQRDAISHIKCQKEKVKGVNSKDKLKMKKKNQLLNFTFLKNRRLRLFLIAMSVLALGIYTPLFYVVSLTIITRFIEIKLWEHLHIVKLWLSAALSPVFKFLLRQELKKW